MNVNSLNSDKLTCLDVAVLLRNLDMVRLLQHYNAKESSACKFKRVCACLALCDLWLISKETRLTTLDPTIEQTSRPNERRPREPTLLALRGGQAPS